MRALSISVIIAMLFVVGDVAVAQAPTAQPVGNLAQVMRGILFPNSNILFDVQTNDPAAPKKEPAAAAGSGASATFANIYTGWQVVENAAIALGEAANLIMIPGRNCENGRPVPLKNPDYVKFTNELRTASRAMLKAAQAKNQELASETTNDVAAACENCHTVYRDKNPRCVP
jgi:hypothetical protein